MKKLKHTLKDVTEADLPANRREVFRDCYREQFSVIFRLGLICLGAFLPCLFVLWLRDAYLSQAAAGGDVAGALRAANVRYGLPLLLAVVLFFLVYAGIVRVVRQLVWREPVFFGDDFRNGWRSDALRFGIIAAFAGVVRLLIGSLSGSAVTYLLFGVYVTLVLPVAIWVLLQNVYYKIGVFGSIRNGILHYLRSLPVTLALLLVTALPLFACLTFVPVVVRYPLLLLFALFGVVPLTMLWLLYASHLFDCTINRETYPGIWRRGLRPLPPEENSPPDAPSAAGSETLASDAPPTAGNAAPDPGTGSSGEEEGAAPNGQDAP